jgi:hypothetical protein
MLKASNFREWAELINKGYRNEYKEPQFKPYLYIKNINKKPSQIFPVAFLGIAYFKHIPVPDVVEKKTLWQQIEMVKDMIHKHFIKYAGKSPLFGDITGYIFFFRKIEGIEFNTEGEIVDYDVQVFPEPRVILKIGSKRLYNGFPGKITKK